MLNLWVPNWFYRAVAKIATREGAMLESVIFLGHFADLPDLRQLIAEAAGAETFTAIIEFGKDKPAPLRPFPPAFVRGSILITAPSKPAARPSFTISPGLSSATTGPDRRRDETRKSSSALSLENELTRFPPGGIACVGTGPNFLPPAGIFVAR